jgi:hypothetical protein
MVVHVHSIHLNLWVEVRNRENVHHVVDTCFQNNTLLNTFGTDVHFTASTPKSLYCFHTEIHSSSLTSTNDLSSESATKNPIDYARCHATPPLGLIVVVGVVEGVEGGGWGRGGVLGGPFFI